MRSGAFIALIALGAGSLLFDVTLPARLPSDADWAEAAGALRSAAQPGDAVQLWPAWAERARAFSALSKFMPCFCCPDVADDAALSCPDF